MIIIRPVNKKDQDIFVEFSFDSALGMRNLPRDRDKLEEKILYSERSFAADVKKPGREEYFFVLEDLTTGRIGGTCGILAHMDRDKAYSFRIQNIHMSTMHPSISKEMKILKLVPPLKNVSEVCSLYLQPTFRHSGQGRLLSLSRFLFIAAHRQRFEKKIISEMRGYIDRRQISPFWEAVGHHFCDLSFVELMSQLEQNLINVKDILPKYPIYVSLLPKEAQDVIGKTHENTKPAMNMLMQEGFTFNNEIDALEGGPSLVAPTSKIRTIKKSRVIKIDTTNELLAEENEYILSNNQINFRACYGNMEIINENKAMINQDVADALLLKKGDNVRYVTLH